MGKELIRGLEPLGAKGFCVGGGWGFRNVLPNKRPVFTPADLKGQTIRVPPVPTLVETMKAFGANPVPMQWGEVYLAMKQGTIDGLELPATTVTSDKFHEITKYYSITRHAYPPGIWTMALPKYNSLPDDLKKVIDESMLAACAQHRQDELKQEVEAFALMRARGVQINEVKDIREFQDRAAPVWKFLEAKVGKEFFDRVVAGARGAGRERARRARLSAVDGGAGGRRVPRGLQPLRAPGHLPLVRRGGAALLHLDHLPGGGGRSAPPPPLPHAPRHRPLPARLAPGRRAG